MRKNKTRLETRIILLITIVVTLSTISYAKNLQIETGNGTLKIDVGNGTDQTKFLNGDVNITQTLYTNNIVGQSGSIKGDIAIGDSGQTKKATMYDDDTNFIINTTNQLRIINNMIADKNITAQYFIGDGSYLTNLNANGIAPGTYNINITGNSATVTNGVYTTGSYNDPTWITGLAAAKITGLNNSHTLDWNNITNKPTNLDLDSTDDLTNTTTFSGDVSGTYTNLQLGTGVVGNTELNNTQQYTISGLTVNGIVNATTFIGDGSQLTGVVSMFANTSGNATFTAGNVGIGTTNPTQRLSVNGSANISGTVYANQFIGDGSQLSGVVSMFANTSGNATFTSGNVGIGTTNATSALTIGGNEKIEFKSSGPILDNTLSPEYTRMQPQNNELILYDGAHDQKLIVQAGSGGSDGIRIEGGSSTVAVNAQGNPDLTLKTSGTERMRILQSNGNIGIGTSTPNQALTVNGNTNVTGTVYANQFIGDGSQLTGVVSMFANTSGNATFVAGNVGIGTTTPTNALTVIGTVNATTFIGDGSQLTGVVSMFANTSGNATFTTGNVGIGTTNPTQKLTVVGDMNVTGTATINNLTTTGQSSMNGNIAIGDTNQARKATMYDDDTNFIINTTNQLRIINNMIADKNITAQYFIGDGTYLTNINAATVTNGVYTTGSYNDPTWITGLSAAKITGLDNSHTLDWNNITNKPTNYTMTQLNVTGTVYATTFIGDGSQLTGISTTQVWTNTSGNATFVAGNVGIGTTTPTNKLTIIGTVNATSFVGDGSGLTNVVTKYVGKTTNVYNGNLTSGIILGYEAANNLCNQNYIGSHLCTQDELIRTIYLLNISQIDWTGSAWVNAGGPKYTPASYPVDDCKGWTNQTGYALGNFWIFSNTTGGGKGAASPCDQTKPLACCK